MTNIKKWPAMDQKKIEKLQHYWENGRSIDGIDPDIKAHLLRMRTMGDGKGIEVIGNTNKDYLGAFMAPFSRDTANALSKNFMGTTEPWLDGKFDIPFDLARIIDYGTVDTYGCFDLTTEVEVALEQFSKIVNEDGCSTFMWGGDHTVTYVPIHCLGELHGPLGIIHFDAHYDLVTKADFPYPYHSGNMFTKNMAEGNLDPERMITMGVRGRMSGLVGGHAKNLGVTVAMAEECRVTPAEEMAQRVIDIVGDGPTYLTFDVDSLDTIYNHASSAVEPFGLSANWCWDVMKMVRASGKVNLVGADVVEYAPGSDPTRSCGYTAAGLSWKILCWLADDMAKRNGEKRPTVWDMAFGRVSL
jgi:arginase family enzyme